MFDPKIFTKGFRDDGWPYCPDCGMDELYINNSVLNENDRVDDNTGRGIYDYDLKCLFCGWIEA